MPPKPPKINPLGLNKLQLKTLTILQELARDPAAATPEADGGARISQWPHAHGDHLHIGGAVVAAGDATGLTNEAVWRALERKGLARSLYPIAIVLSAAGLGYDTGLKSAILRRAAHD